MSKILSSVAIAALLLTVACGKNDDNPTPPAAKAKIMFGNTTISADTVRAQINDTTVVGASALAFLSTTGYISVDPGSKKLGFIHNTGLPLVETTTTLTANNAYSVFSAGTITNPEIVVVQDDLTAPVAGRAKVRFINLSSDTVMYRAYVGTGDTALLGNNVAYKGSTPFKQYTAGSYNIIVQRVDTNSSNPPDVVSVSNYALTAGKIYTVLLTGRMALPGSAARAAKIITNN